MLFVGGALLIGGGFVLAHLNGRPEEPPITPGTPKDAPDVAANPVQFPNDDWSKPVNGLQARVVLVEKARSNGTRMLHPYLDLRNAGDMAYPLKVRLGGAAHVKFKLVDADGKVVDDGQRGARDGPYPDPGTISLPRDSSLRVGMFCTNWGVPQDAAAMIATDSGAWVLKPEQEGRVFLRVKVTGKKQDEDGRIWFGNLEAKTRVTWPGEAAQRAQPAAAAEKGPKLWAAISINQPVFLQHEETGPGLFQMQFSVANDGDAVIDPEIESSQLIINGKEFKDWKLVIGNGPRTGEWKALPAGRYVQFGYAVGSYFNEPGVYRVSWKGKHFESPEIVFRVMPKNVKIGADDSPKATRVLEGSKTTFPAKSVPEGVKLLIGVLESCHDISDETVNYSTEDLKKAQKGDHLPFVFPKPIKCEVLEKKLGVSEAIYAKGVFWLVCGKDVVQGVRELILYAAKNEVLSKVWNLSVISEAIASRWSVWMRSRQSSMAPVKVAKSG